MSTLPTNRTTSNTDAEHVADHNEIHRLHNLLDGLETTAVKTSGNQTIAGTKTFSSAPVVPDASWSIADTSGLQTALDARVQSVNGVDPDPVTGDVSVTVTPDPTGYKDVTTSATQSVTSSTTLVNHTTLKAAMAANETWDFELFVRYEADEPTGDMKTALTVPTGATIYGSGHGLSSGAGGNNGSQLLASISSSGQVFTFGGLGAGVHTVLRYSVRVVNGSTAGDFQFQFAQSGSSATSTTVLAGSNLIGVRR